MNIDSILKELSIPVSARRVYSELLSLGFASAKKISDNLSMTRPSVYDQLNLLVKEGLVVEFENENKKEFKIEDVNRLSVLLNEKILLLKEQEKALKKELPKLKREAKNIEPRVKFYSGKESFRQVLTDVLWYEGAEIYVMWPFGDMNEVIGEEYLKTFTKRRLHAGITVKSIWARGKNTYVEKIPNEITRVAPPGMNWHMGYIIYGEKVAFISSRYESFAFVVSSRDFSELKRAEFEQIWKVSKVAKLS